MRRKRNKQQGFTVAELLAVIAIIGILVAMAALSMDYVRRERLSGATRTLLADLQLARGRSLTTAPPDTMPDMRGFGINFVSGSSYNTFTFNDQMGMRYQFDDPAEAANVRTTNLPPSVQMTIGGAAPDNRIMIFDRFGIPRTDNWAIANMTIILRYQNLGGLTKCIVISETRIREGNWNGAACEQQ